MAEITPGDGDPRHGTHNGYTNCRCRCQDCRDANAAYYREGPAAKAKWKYRQRLVEEGRTTDGRGARKVPYRPRGTSSPIPPQAAV